MTQPPSPTPDAAHRAAAFSRFRQRLPHLDVGSGADKSWSLAAHFGGAAGMLITFGVGGWIVPLIVLLTKGNQSPTVREHSLRALNFQLLWSIIGLLAWLIAWRPPVFLPLLAVTLVGVVFGVIGGLRANEGQLYRYPLSAQFVS